MPEERWSLAKRKASREGDVSSDRPSRSVLRDEYPAPARVNATYQRCYFARFVRARRRLSTAAAPMRNVNHPTRAGACPALQPPSAAAGAPGFGAVSSGGAGFSTTGDGGITHGVASATCVAKGVFVMPM